MSDVSRRAFVAQATVGAAALGVLAVARVRAETPADAAVGSLAESGPVVARVRDARTGQVELFVGDREVVVTDKALARSLLIAASTT